MLEGVRQSSAVRIPSRFLKAVMQDSSCEVREGSTVFDVKKGRGCDLLGRGKSEAGNCLRMIRKTSLIYSSAF